MKGPVPTATINVAEIQDFLSHVYPADFTTSSELREPYVTLTYAQSLDAKIAGKEGKQLLLSGKESMAMTHRLRAMHNAILVGIGTVLNDDPQLNCRIPELLPMEEQPQPFIMDAQCRTPLDCKLIRNAKVGIGRWPIIVCSQQKPLPEGKEQHIKALAEAGCQVWMCETDLAGRIDLYAFMNMLSSRRSSVRLMVEGGSQIISSFLSSMFVNTLIVTVAPTFVGEDGVPVTSPGAEGQLWLPTLKHRISRQFGIDTVVACTIRPPPSASGNDPEVNYMRRVL